MGYPARASVPAGEDVPLFVSTTSRWFRVRAFRMGWYRGDLARMVWESGPVRGTHVGGAGVFSTGTMRWVRSFTGNIDYGIDQRTARFARRVTANLLRAFADGPAAATHPARDNLRDAREWPGDPIAAGHSLW